MTDQDNAAGGRAESDGEALDSTVNLTSSIDQIAAADPGHDSAMYVKLDDETRHVVEQLPPRCAILTVRTGPNRGARFLLDTPSTIVGRDPSSSIFLDDVTVSRSHAEFLQSDDGFTVRDLGSLNGTYLNRARVDSSVLSDEDEVQIGKYRLTYYYSPNA